MHAVGSGRMTLTQGEVVQSRSPSPREVLSVRSSNVKYIGLDVHQESLDRPAAGCPVTGPDADALPVRTKRQLWTYSGLAVVTHDSAQHRYVDGQLQRSKKPQQIRGLNQNHNHEMKSIFKGTALSASQCAGPLQDFYAGLLTKGMKPEMTRLT